MQPAIPKINNLKTCARCKQNRGIDAFTKTASYFYPDGTLPICNDCVNKYLEKFDYSWDAIDKVCQWADIPFIVEEWERIRALNEKEDCFKVYAKVFSNEDYNGIGWSDYFRQYKKLKESGLIEAEIPELREERLAKLRQRWGENYDESELYYLEELLKGLQRSQNVNGALAMDQALKLCRISLEIDKQIREGNKDVSKFLSAYDAIIKAADFTPKNNKNAADFDSCGELWTWLEKRGFVNKGYDGATRDVIDETLKNIESYNQRLYVNESSIGEEITKKIENLKSANALEKLYDIDSEFDSDEYEIDGFRLQEEEEDFKIEEEE